uniref:Uncharacterized protein n=1 Tax=Lactuca sativa TaxID=4236 RepID=A0A9R1UZM5_LACSA|nr:hypothetical protein LSAT_V11C700362760 [Lactuca sativa]
MKIIEDVPSKKILSILKVVQFTVIKVCVFAVPLYMLSWIYCLIVLLFIPMVYFPLFMFYFSMWTILKTQCKSVYMKLIHLYNLYNKFDIFLPFFHAYTVKYIANIEKKHREPEEAKEILKLVCDEIDKLKTTDKPHDPRYYKRPVHEAARQDAYEVVDEILMRCPEAIRYKDKSGYDIVQLAVMHRSENIYELINILGERRNVYRTIEDSSQNNMLHLVGRLAPTHKLKLRTGAALQLQRELQWHELIIVEGLVCKYIQIS